MKAQMIGQVFIYVMTVLIVSFLLFYGYKAIVNFKDKADQVSLIQFKNDLENAVESLSFDYGSVKVKEFTLPENTEKLCIVKNYPEMPKISGTGYPLMEDSINSGVTQNVFLLSSEIEESFFVENIDITGDILCKELIGNKIKLRIEGMGNHAIISP